MTFVRSIRRRVVALTGLLLLGAPVAAIAQGTITGRVVVRDAAEPIPEARVIVVGTTVIATSNADGQFTLRNVPTGEQTVRVMRVGFAEQKATVTVAAGQTATLEIRMSPVAIKLAEVVTTATGTERTVTQGNSIAQIDAAELTKTRPITSIGDLLTTRAPGVQVMPNNMTGASVRVRIRGASSLSLANDPIYIIDGVRMTSDNGSMSISAGGTSFSRVGDINPQDIENIEVVKGPSAATLYGTDAANGVIVITTRRGRAGRARWNAFAENGVIDDRNTYPTAYTLFGHSPAAPAITKQCFLSDIASGTCVRDSLLSFNLWEDPETTPLGLGQRQQYGVSASGGSDAVTYFVSGGYEKELGVYTIPKFDRRRLDSLGVDVLSEWLRPNALEQQNVRVNLTSAPSSTLDLQTSAGYIHLNQRLPQTDNNTTGLASSAYGGPGYRNNGLGSLGFPKNGYRVFTPGDIFQETFNQQINRFIGGVNANWRPFSWMANRANVGVDYTSRTETDLCRRANCSDFGTSRLGFSIDNRTNIRNFSFDVATSGTFQPRPSVSAKTTLGAQYVNYAFDRNGAEGDQLAPGTVTPADGAVPSVSASTSYTKTLGVFAEEAVAVRDRLFLTGALRSDQNSAFGTNFHNVFYPKLSASYVISEEEYFPRIPMVDQLRLRATYGAAGTQPGPNDALRYFAAAQVNADRSDVNGIILSSVGNPNLKPERATEFEGGFDAKLLGQRVNLELTYYSKLTKDALISRVLPPSAGVSVSRFENLGSVKNAGVEGQVTAQILDSRRLGWSTTFSASRNDNKLVDLGPVPPIVGTLIQERAGYPLFGWWSRPITGYADENGDGLLSPSEVTVGDTAVFLGYSAPRYEMSLNNGFDLLNRTVRIAALFDYKGGYKGNNDTQRIRCQNRLNCREEADPTASLEHQARVIALRDNPARTQAGFIEDGSFVRFRELSVTYDAPERMASRVFRAQSASLTFAARNLHVWSKYSGVDPESSYGSGDVPNDFQTAPPPTYFTLRLNLGF
jgi:TonB-linked SusC/RagA family outer membrane protein